MKTNKQLIKDFDAVGFMRQERNRISNDIADLSKEQVIEYFKKNKSKERIIPCGSL
jgi:hypothetical protein